MKIALIILSVVGIGMFTVNQTLKFFYSSELLQKPCELCLSLNPRFESCFENAPSGVKINTTSDFFGSNNSLLLFDNNS